MHESRLLLANVFKSDVEVLGEGDRLRIYESATRGSESLECCLPQVASAYFQHDSVEVLTAQNHHVLLHVSLIPASIFGW